MNSWNVFIVDDHPLIRSSLRHLVEEIDGFECQGEAADLKTAASKLKFQRIDLILLDLSLVEGDSLAQLAKWKAENPARKIVLVTMHRDWQYLERAVEAGADGYLLKDSPLEALKAALVDVLAHDKKVFPRQVPDRAVPDEVSARIASLSAREKEVLKLIALGYMNREIAESLGLSVRTVESHRARILSKLGVKNAAALAAYGQYLA